MLNPLLQIIKQVKLVIHWRMLDAAEESFDVEYGVITLIGRFRTNQVCCSTIIQVDIFDTTQTGV